MRDVCFGCLLHMEHFWNVRVLRGINKALGLVIVCCVLKSDFAAPWKNGNTAIMSVCMKTFRVSREPQVWANNRTLKFS